MNIVNVNKAIAVMERVKSRGDLLNMSLWQFIKDGEAVQDEETLHTCGMAACFGGWVAISPEWKADGGTVLPVTGTPGMRGEYHEEAIALWLDIPDKEAEGLTCTTSEQYSVYPDKEIADVTVDDVLEALYRLRDTGSVYAGGAQ